MSDYILNLKKEISKKTSIGNEEIINEIELGIIRFRNEYISAFITYIHAEGALEYIKDYGIKMFNLGKEYKE
jgi:hypothetical protein